LALAALLAGLVLGALLLLTGFLLSTLLLLARFVLSALLWVLVRFVCHRDVLRAGNPPPEEITRKAEGGSSPSKQHLDTTIEFPQLRRD
jgi:hypothetical protein